MSIRHAASIALWATLLTACASGPYHFGAELETERTLHLEAGEAQIERGRPDAFLDTVGNIVSLPVKLLLWNRRVDNHRISEETERAVEQYLADNGLANVKVRLNQYDPGGEWSRLVANKEVHPLWRYTLGTLTVAAYTFFPQRVFGGDNYNPFTNTISLYSDLPAVALHEGGHAKDFAGRSRKGLYASLRLLPLAPLYQEARATQDAIGYERATNNPEGERSAYKVLYPAFGTYVGGELVQLIPLSSTGLVYAVQYGAVLPFHLIGRVRARLVQDAPEHDLDLIPPPLGPADRSPR
jgi:hypothetical protein